MSWKSDSLLAKARHFFDRALAHDRDDPQFGLWCALGLELLARAAVSSVSPTLLAEPSRDHRNLLHAVGRGDPRDSPKSLGCVQVFHLCKTLFDDFRSEHVTAATALIDRRNAELHTGEDAFADYTTQKWIPGFYACCRVLAIPLSETIATILGEAEAAEADKVLATEAKEVKQRVEKQIASYRRVFEDKADAERQAARAAAEAAGELLAHHRHHRVVCPACKSVATVQGEPFSKVKVIHDDDGTIKIRQPMAPRRFACSVCNLKLDGYGELVAAGLGDQYTRTTSYSPEEFYELISPDDHETISRIAREHLGLYDPYEEEYDNE